MKKYLFLLACSCFSFCSNKINGERFTCVVANASETKRFTFKLKQNYYLQKMIISENTLNDTCLIGIMKVPPGKTGKMYSVEFMDDSLTYQYQPYKATKGKLVFEHLFTDGY